MLNSKQKGQILGVAALAPAVALGMDLEVESIFITLISQIMAKKRRVWLPLRDKEYRRASDKVVVWLQMIRINVAIGEGDEECAEAMDFAINLCSIISARLRSLEARPKKSKS